MKRLVTIIAALLLSFGSGCFAQSPNEKFYNMSYDELVHQRDSLLDVVNLLNWFENQAKKCIR